MKIAHSKVALLASFFLLAHHKARTKNVKGHGDFLTTLERIKRNSSGIYRSLNAKQQGAISTY